VSEWCIQFVHHFWIIAGSEVKPHVEGFSERFEEV
jgi:hypothetical protein